MLLHPHIGTGCGSARPSRCRPSFRAALASFGSVTTGVQQVGDVPVQLELEHLGVDEDEACSSSGVRVKSMAQEHGVDADALAGARGAAHQQVGHAWPGRRCRGLPVDRLAQGHGQGRRGACGRSSWPRACRAPRPSAASCWGSRCRPRPCRGWGRRCARGCAFSAMAMSSLRPEILLSLMPGAGRNSNVVTTGPGRMAVTSPFTPKSPSFSTRVWPRACSASLSNCATSRSCVSSRPRWGSSKGARVSMSMRARPLSEVPPDSSMPGCTAARSGGFEATPAGDAGRTPGRDTGSGASRGSPRSTSASSDRSSGSRRRAGTLGGTGRSAAGSGVAAADDSWWSSKRVLRGVVSRTMTFGTWPCASAAGLEARSAARLGTGVGRPGAGAHPSVCGTARGSLRAGSGAAAERTAAGAGVDGRPLGQGAAGIGHRDAVGRGDVDGFGLGPCAAPPGLVATPAAGGLGGIPLDLDQVAPSGQRAAAAGTVGEHRRAGGHTSIHRREVLAARHPGGLGQRAEHRLGLDGDRQRRGSRGRRAATALGHPHRHHGHGPGAAVLGSRGRAEGLVAVHSRVVQPRVRHEVGVGVDRSGQGRRLTVRGACARGPILPLVVIVPLAGVTSKREYHIGPQAGQPLGESDTEASRSAAGRGAPWPRHRRRHARRRLPSRRGRRTAHRPARCRPR